MRIPGFCGMVRIVAQLFSDNTYRVRSVVYRRGHGWHDLSADFFAAAGVWQWRDGYRAPVVGGTYRPAAGDVCLCAVGENGAYVLVPVAEETMLTPDGPISFKAADQPLTVIRPEESSHAT